MRNEAIRLSIKFFEEVKRFEKDGQGKITAKEEYKIKVMDDAKALLVGGMSVSEIESLLDRYKLEHPAPEEAYIIDDVLKFFGVNAKKGVATEDPNNLLQAGKFYYHPRLQHSPPPPTLELLDDGTFKCSYEDEPFFLEVLDRFTIDDVIDYFYSVMDIQVDTYRRRDTGAFQHLLRNYDIDIVMFTIGEAAFMADDLNKRRPRHPFDLEEYIEDGIALMDERKNTLFMEGLDHVIPR